MTITYYRPDTLGYDEIDPAAPLADLSPLGHDCGAAIDVDGVDWWCTRAPHAAEGEHRAAYDRDGDGPDGAVGIAWIDE